MPCGASKYTCGEELNLASGNDRRRYAFSWHECGTMVVEPEENLDDHIVVNKDFPLQGERSVTGNPSGAAVASSDGSLVCIRIVGRGPLIVFWEARRTVEFRPHCGLNPFDVDWFIASGLFQGLLARHLFNLAVEEGNREERRAALVFCAQANAIMATILDFQMQCGLSWVFGVVRDCKLVLPRRKMKGHKALTLSMRHSLVAIKEPTGKGSRAHGDDSAFKLLFGGKPN